MNSSTDSESKGTSTALRTARIVVLAVLLIAISGVFVGFFVAHRDDGGGTLSRSGLASLAIAALAGTAVVIQMIRDMRALRSGLSGIPRRERASLRLVGLAMVAGLLGGVATVFAGEAGLVDANGVLSPVLAVIAMALLATLGPWLTWRWWRAIDEHEQAAYVEGANIAGHFTLFAGIAWWVLARARLVPEPDVMVLIVAMSFVWTGVWFYRRFF
jgi:hypothetical protein